MNIIEKVNKLHKAAGNDQMFLVAMYMLALEELEDLMKIYPKEAPLYDELDEILDTRHKWYAQGKCNECGSRFEWENDGYLLPDPEMWKVYCPNCK